MLILLENHDITILLYLFFQIFDLGNIFENVDQKVPKNVFCLLKSQFSKILPKLKN